MSKFKFSKRSLDNLVGVNEALIKIVHKALEISEIDFTVVEGVRTLEKQKEYVAKGVSKTMNSYHIPNKNGGRAVDLYPYYNGSVQINNTDDKWAMIYCAMMQAAKEYGETITWGGSWKFIDKPHYQIEGK